MAKTPLDLRPGEVLTSDAARVLRLAAALEHVHIAWGVPTTAGQQDLIRALDRAVALLHEADRPPRDSDERPVN